MFAVVAVSAFCFSCTDYKETDAPETLSVNATELSFSPAASSSSVMVSSGSKWTVSNKPDWVSVQSISSSAGEFQWNVSFSVTDNNDYDREGVITINAGSGSASIVVRQSGKKGKYVAVESVTLTPSSLTLTEGETSKLTAIVSPSNASVKTVAWKSDKPSVATIDDQGNVTAVAVGTALITATTDDGGKSARCTVTVQAKFVSVTSVTLDKSSLTLKIGETETLTATVNPDNATDKSVTWSSSDTNVATVSSSGMITAKAVGTATITVTTTDGGKKATCALTVNPISVTGVTLDQTSLVLVEGETGTLVATVAPANATNKSVTWSSNKPSVATVSSSGVVTAVSVGTATITVTTSDGGKKATCTVTVNPIAVTGVSLNKTVLYMEVGEVQTLKETITPYNAADKSVIWWSDNPSVATVSPEGVVVALEVGNATITVKTNDGGKTATCSVTVSAVSVTGVSLNKTSLSMVEGETQTLTATIAPSNATDKSVTWSSSNTSVATVSSSGSVTAKSAGTATITVRTNDGGKTATCTVVVSASMVSVTGVSLDKSSLTLTEGDTVSLTATVTPSNATDKSVTWSSSNATVATVSSSGLVTAKKAGTATITVTTVDGGKKATCAVTVKSKDIGGSGNEGTDEEDLF